MNVNGLSELSHRRRIGEGNYGSVDEYTFRGQVMAVKRIFLVSLFLCTHLTDLKSSYLFVARRS